MLLFNIVRTSFVSLAVDLRVELTHDRDETTVLNNETIRGEWFQLCYKHLRTWATTQSKINKRQVYEAKETIKLITPMKPVKTAEVRVYIMLARAYIMLACE